MLISIKDLKKDFINGDVITSVLKGVSFEIEKGSFISIMGPSGSGKSTLMHILSFLDKPTSGDYFFDDKNVKDSSDDGLADMRSKKVGFIFQSFNLLSTLSVLENVALPLTYTGISAEKRTQKAKDLLTQVGLVHRLNYSPTKLSGGEKQRVAIARALVNDPEVIFADEPTGNLDSKSGAQVMKILQELNKKGNTIILVTHEKSTAEHAERIIKIKDGNIIEDTKNFCRQEAQEDLNK
ncbi:MAG: ABC transporter ATP-binding protein [Candidatus Pacebacteria bacterium]|nr:ABC transporter ATP-binding protein [Candidatus Paceibacterota bacterium]MDD2757042.1 ABC transporter ATP-binding protein [Candidatus Paceibacterota bacterium]MDD3283551.1 ABC transporter ATP-binding protein [Candidatus Paceibacterota bacterium]MDD3969592.1 ABC transporter ATP-binding protein [Candidatus Paceibacterota bacterium]MDD4737862.1 ABC transporter ATP-binding protein [Candidatus Paceibacterota bacterium]